MAKKNKPKKKPCKYSKKVIVACLISIWIFIILNFVAMLFASITFPDALIVAFFSVFGVEFYSLAKIKKAEIDKGKDEKTEDDIDISDLEKEIQMLEEQEKE